MKSKATILDATAGTRCIWRTKTSPYILWIDIESEVEPAPDTVMDCRETHFEDKHFTTIFFDPPHSWGQKVGEAFYTCRNKAEADRFYAKYGYTGDKKPWGKPTYYGTDKVQSKIELLSLVNKAQQEFMRILKDDGMLWVKWCDWKIPYQKILPFFKDWNLMLKFETAYRGKVPKNRTWWLMFMKNHSLS